MILAGECLEQMKKMESGLVDLIVTDPPYGYSFMGKDWDKAVPSVEIWQEALRVLKPGAFAFVMSAPRSDVQNAMISRMMEAGFRMDFTPIYWTYASGFPKAGNIGKLVDKRLGNKREVLPPKQFADGTTQRQTARAGIYSEQKGQAQNTKGKSPLEGSYAGFQPKPAVEVILVAMKPLDQKTFVDQALDNGKGITWLDDVRVPTSEEVGRDNTGQVAPKLNPATGWNKNSMVGQNTVGIHQGRFPANLLVSDDVLNDGRVTSSKENRSHVHQSKVQGSTSFGRGSYQPINDSGSYSRYFDMDKWWSERLKDLPESVQKTFPYLIAPKASKSEKNDGTQHMPERMSAGMPMRSAGGERGGIGGDGSNTDRLTKMTNHHPTVKPIKLMSYLITLGSRKGDTVLDPFVGSGTTCVAAKAIGRESIGIELDPEYAEIAKARLKAISQLRLPV